MGKKSGPDVSGAATIEGEFAREAARDVTYADRPTQYNPFGSVDWGTEAMIDPATGERVTKWTQSQNLSPEMQTILDANTGMIGGRAQIAQGMMSRIQNEMGGAPDWDQFGDVHGMDFDPTQIRTAAEDAAYTKEMNRLDPQFQREGEQLEIKLRNQGLRPGDQAYDAAMSQFGLNRNDAFEQARLGATKTGMNESAQMWDMQRQALDMSNALRGQQIEEYLGKRGFSAGESAMLTEGQSLPELIGMFGGGGAA